MRSQFQKYPDHYERPIAVAGGTAFVAYSYSGPKVESPNGTAVPERFSYVETPNDPAAPIYVIECGHDDQKRVRIEAVHVRRRPDGREIWSSDLRRMRSLEDVVESAWLAASFRTGFAIGDSLEEVTDALERAVAIQLADDKRAIRGVRRQLRRKVTPELLAEVAEVYRENLPTGKPTLAVREHFGLAESTASLYVKRAREARLDMGDGNDG
ncbi:hypothetical protein [Cellulomonas sp. URHB0016]